jgi:hypothetical protein
MSVPPPGDEVLAVRPPFELRRHEEMVAPSNAGLLRRLLDVLLVAGPGAMTGRYPGVNTDFSDAAWRLQVWEGPDLLFSSFALRDWESVEALAVDWQTPLRSLDDASIRRGWRSWPTAGRT